MISRIVTYCQARSFNGLSSQRMEYSTAANQSNKNVESNDAKKQSKVVYEDKPIFNKRDRLRKMIREYGVVVLVFHISIALMSLGTFYILVSRSVVENQNYHFLL